MTHVFTEEQLLNLRRLLASSRKNESAAARLLLVLNNPAVIPDLERNADAVRGALRKLVAHDAGLLTAVESDVEWPRLVARAAKRRAAVADPGERRMVVAEMLAMLVAGLVEGRGAGLGTGARRVVAAAGMQIARESLVSEKGDGSVVSVRKLSAELMMMHNPVGHALDAGVEAGVLSRRATKHRSGASRFTIRRRDVSKPMLRYGAIINALLEHLGSTPISYAEMGWGGERYEDARMRKRQARLARAAKSKFDLGKPCGLMTRLDPRKAGKVAAEIIVSATSPIWSTGMGGKRVSADLWLAMLLGTLGIEVEGPTLSRRMERELRRAGGDAESANAYLDAVFGVGVVERLNSGQSLTSILSVFDSPEIRSRADGRMASWASKSSEIRAATSAWVTSKDHGEKAVHTLLGRAAGAPRFEAGEAERWTFTERMREVVAAAGLTDAAAALVSERLKWRLTEYRGWPLLDAEMAVGVVFPGTARAAVSEPVEVGGVLV